MRKVQFLSPIIAFSLSAILLRTDFMHFILWCATLFFVGLVFLPLAMKVFSKFFDFGYLFSKTLGIAIPAYVLWLLSTLKILPFNSMTVFLVYATAIAIVGGIQFFTKNYKGFFAVIMDKEVLTKLLIEESMFILAMAIWAFLRGVRPEIQGNGGLEKFMDLGFVNTILNSSNMPPVDIWFAGQSINYYYFGHYITAFLTKLTGISSAITYNLMMATLFSFAFVLTFSITSNITLFWNKDKLKKAITAGLISALLMTLGSNLHTVMFTTVFPIIKNSGILDKQLEVRDNYWFPDATRFIGHNPNTLPPDEDKTIHEFPSYSFIVSDLHAHVINLPFVLTIIALIMSYLWGMIDKIKKKEEIIMWRRMACEIPLFAFFIGIFMMSNYWDFPIYLTVTAIAFLYINLTKYNLGTKSIIYTIVQIGFVFLIAYIIALPFTSKLTSLTNGIGLTHTKSALFQFLIIWGYQLFLVISFVLVVFHFEKKYLLENYNLKKHKKNIFLDNTKIGLFKSINKTLFEGNFSDVFIFIIAFSAIGLILLPEVIYVKDIYVGGYYRSNTMFKLTYQAYIMFALAAGYISVRILDIKTKRDGFRIFKAIVIFIIICPLMYPFFSIPGWYGKLNNMRYKGLDGVAAYFEKNLPDDYEAIKWLKENEKEQPVILEAFGDSYTDYCRVSTITGFPTIIGWGTHEWLWRNNNTLGDERRTEVTTIYESNDIEVTKKIVDKYKIKYIIIGKLERDKFKKLQEEKLIGLGKVVFTSNDTKVIELGN